MTGQRTGYSLIEVIMVVLIIGALTFIAVPRLNFAALYHKQAHAAAMQVVTDLRRTRTMAISMAATNPTGFTLERSGLSYQIIDDSNGVAVDSQTIAPQISCGDGTVFSFGPLGNLRTGSNNQLTVSAEGRTYTITVISGTGIVECTGS
ncbi:MAG: type II secretion system protein [Sedimentisphaerales bacterium]|jgi:prepilin-type N-terminal cleavage/methylation domain-containing protein